MDLKVTEPYVIQKNTPISSPVARNFLEKYSTTVMINTQRDFLLLADLVRKMHYENKK